MPGITGYILPQLADDDGRLLAQMLLSMCHDSSYSSGKHRHTSLGLGIGWTCHRGSYSDCMPIWNENHDIALFFSGEHYADPIEYQRLKTAGHSFAVDDARALVHLYEEEGSDFFSKLNGTYCGVLVDLRLHKVMLFNDRFGLGRVYYHESPKGIYFSTEAKAILGAESSLRRFDQQGLGEMLVCGAALQNRSIFPDIFLLPPGSLWTFSPQQAVRKETYASAAAWENQTQLDAETYYEALKSAFNRVLPRYFHGQRKVGLSITGGLDSRMIIAGISGKPGQLSCYTFGGTYRDSEDVRIGRLVAGLCQQPHGVIKLDENFFPRYRELAERCVFLTDGAMDVSGSVGLYVNRLALQYGEVRMTGNYGSEILRGNVAFNARSTANSAFTALLRPHLTAAMETYRTERQSCRPLTFIAFKQVPWYHYARLAEEQSQLTIRAPYLDNELVALAYRAPSGSLLNKQLALRYTNEMQPALNAAPTDRGWLERPRYIPAKLFELCKEFWPKAEYYYDYGMPQWLAKADRLAAPLHLERLFLGQQKYYHFRYWYRTVLADQVKEVLLDPLTLSRPYLDRRLVERMVFAHTSGSGNHTIEIHRLMTLEFIERTLLRSG